MLTRAGRARRLRRELFWWLFQAWMRGPGEGILTTLVADGRLEDRQGRGNSTAISRNRQGILVGEWELSVRTTVPLFFAITEVHGRHRAEVQSAVSIAKIRCPANQSPPGESCWQCVRARHCCASPIHFDSEVVSYPCR